MFLLVIAETIIEYAIAPEEPEVWIPGVNCFQGRRKREAQNIAYAIAPDPYDLLPPCPRPRSCFTEKGYVCKLAINHPFRNFHTGASTNYRVVRQ